VARPAEPSPIGSDPDRELVDRARQGDQDAVRCLVEKYERRLVAVAWGLVGSRSEAEDVTQDALVRAFGGLARFAGRSSFRTWLFQIVVNAARTFRQRQRRRREDYVGSSAEFEDVASAGSLEGAVLTRDAVRRALSQLPDELREAVLLRDVEGLEYREIALGLQIPIGTVESRIFRGRSRLRAILNDNASRPVKGRIDSD
jgi:RNA polymerase sigma-70 factor (ECF subfamily)